MMKIRKYLIFSLCLIFFPFGTEANGRKVYHINSNDFINKTINLTPGKGVYLSFPEEVITFTNNDQSIFSCAIVSHLSNRLNCKSLTAKPYETNLFITTDHNDYNLILKIDSIHSSNPALIEFKNNFLSEKKSENIKVENGLIDKLLYKFQYNRCSSRSKNYVFNFDCIERLRFGLKEFVKFRIKSTASYDFSITHVSTEKEKLGKYTELPMEALSPAISNYLLTSENLTVGEEIVGIIEIPYELNTSKRNIYLVIQTNLPQKSQFKIKL